MLIIRNLQHDVTLQKLIVKDMKPTLVVLAAGMGSRYGGLKQIDTLGPSGQAILQYSCFDAARAGFGKVVFVIRRDIEKDFKEVIISKVSRSIACEYCFQDKTDLPEGFSLPADREKPWGTAHAVFAARNNVHEPFAVINSDDYYGRSAFETLGKHLASINNDSTEHAMVGYVLEKTMSRNGSVSRGVCTVKDGKLDSIVENLKIYFDGDKIISDLGDRKVQMTGKETVSMNLFGFSPKAFEEFNSYWSEFIRNNVAQEKTEALLPVAASDISKKGLGTIKVYTSEESWFGMTYPEDREVVKSEIANKIASGYYPEILWEK